MEMWKWRNLNRLTFFPHLVHWKVLTVLKTLVDLLQDNVDEVVGCLEKSVCLFACFFFRITFGQHYLTFFNF